MQFKLPEILAMSNGVRYNPALGVAINTMLNTRDSVEYQNALQEATQIAIGYENVKIYTKKDYGFSSNLSGMPLFMPLKLKGTDGLEDLLLESAVVEVNRTKNIVSTVITDRDASVDEFINNGDWQISVTGFLCNNEAQYPLDLLLKFEEFMSLKKAIEIEHEAMNAIGIYEIVVLSENPIMKTAHINVQPYAFTAKSSKPLPLIIEDKPVPKFI